MYATSNPAPGHRSKLDADSGKYKRTAEAFATVYPRPAIEHRPCWDDARKFSTKARSCVSQEAAQS